MSDPKFFEVQVHHDGSLVGVLTIQDRHIVSLIENEGSGDHIIKLSNGDRHAISADAYRALRCKLKIEAVG